MAFQYTGQYVALEQPGEAAGRGELQREGRQQLAGVAELRQHHPAALDGRRATAVTVVAQRQPRPLRSRRFSATTTICLRAAAASSRWRCREHRRGRRSRHGGHVAGSPGRLRTSRPRRPGRWRRRRSAAAAAARAAGRSPFPPAWCCRRRPSPRTRPCARAVDLHQVGIERQLGRIFAHVLHQRRNEIGDTEQRRAGRSNSTSMSCSTPSRSQWSQDGTWPSAAPGADRHRRLGEQRLAAAQAHQLPGVGRQVVAVVGVTPLRPGSPPGPRCAPRPGAGRGERSGCGIPGCRHSPAAAGAPRGRPARHGCAATPRRAGPARPSAPRVAWA